MIVITESGTVSTIPFIQVRVGCVTADFSMQNVLLQMGMNVVSVDGLLIRRVKTFSLRCEACFRITHEVHRKFCRGCGHPTLYKITVTTDADGRVEYVDARCLAPPCSFSGTVA